jgi:hypothetical protein
MHQSSLYQLPAQECGYKILDMTWTCSAIYCRHPVFIVVAYFNSTSNFINLNL